jgi:hypothetical protein
MSATIEHRLTLLQLLPLGSIQPIRSPHSYCPPVFSMPVATIYISAIAPNKSVRKSISARVHLVDMETTNPTYVFTSSELQFGSPPPSPLIR